MNEWSKWLYLWSSLKASSGAFSLHPTLPGWPRSCDEEGRSALGTLIGRQWGAGHTKSTAVSPSQSPLGLGELVWAFNRDVGKEAPHQDIPSPSPSAGKLTLLVVTSV